MKQAGTAVLLPKFQRHCQHQHPQQKQPQQRKSKALCIEENQRPQKIYCQLRKKILRALPISLRFPYRAACAIPTPIRAYRAVHTKGKRIGGGERGDCTALSRNKSIPSRLSAPESMPAATLNRIQKRQVFRVLRFNYITRYNLMHRMGNKEEAAS